MFFHFLRMFVLVAGLPLVSLYSGISGCAGPTDDVAATFPETCADVQESAVADTGERPPNGTYTLYINGDEAQPWDAYCHNMTRSDPTEYLTVDESLNLSQISNNTAVAETSYRRFRIDPLTLEINPLDNTFATNNFEAFTPVFSVDTLESIPAGWAEVQPEGFSMEATPAQSSVSLAGTPFIFSEDILAGDLSVFFCQVDSQEIQGESTAGTGVDVASDLASFTLTAINTNSEEFMETTTREVADCANLGTTATDFSTAAWPLQYSP